jgi:hypothetical protein
MLFWVYFIVVSHFALCYQATAYIAGATTCIGTFGSHLGSIIHVVITVPGILSNLANYSVQLVLER